MKWIIRKILENLVNTLGAAFMAQSPQNLVRMFVLMISRSRSIMDWARSKVGYKVKIFMVSQVSDLKPPWLLVISDKLPFGELCCLRATLFTMKDLHVRNKKKSFTNCL